MSYLLTLDSSSQLGRPENFTVDYPNPFNFEPVEIVDIDPYGNHYVKQKIRWEVALVNASVTYSWHNIKQSFGNNTMTYTYDGVPYTITLADGSYDIRSINREVQRQMKINNHYTPADVVVGVIEDQYFISIESNHYLNKVEISVKPHTYYVNDDTPVTIPTSLTIDSSIGDILGFEPNTIISDETVVSTKTPDVNRGVNSLLIHCSAATSSFMNGISSDIIHHFTPNTGPSSIMSIIPIQLVYLPVSSNSISNINMRITDQSNNLLNLNDEDVSYTLHFRRTSS